MVQLLIPFPAAVEAVLDAGEQERGARVPASFPQIFHQTEFFPLMSRRRGHGCWGGPGGPRGLGTTRTGRPRRTLAASARNRTERTTDQTGQRGNEAPKVS